MAASRSFSSYDVGLRDGHTNVIIVDLGEAAFTSEQVMRITGVTRRRLNYWLDKNVISTDVSEGRGRGRVRLWSFTNLLEVRVALFLRERISLQLLRDVVHALRGRGLAHPLAEVRVAVMEASSRTSRIVVKGADGTWEEPLTGQLVMELVVPLGRFRSELENEVVVDRDRRRRPGVVERRRGRLGSAPVFSGTRVPVAAVKRLQRAGWSDKRILAEYPGLTLADLRAAKVA